VTVKTYRRVIQISVIAILIVVPFLNRQGFSFLTGSLYSFAIGPVMITDPLSGFQVIITTLTFDRTFIVSMFIPILITLNIWENILQLDLSSKHII
jgi:hypothetical protein